MTSEQNQPTPSAPRTIDAEVEAISRGVDLEGYTKQALARFSPTDTVLAELTERCMAVTAEDAADSQGLARVIDSRREVKGLRIAVERTRKDLKRDALEFGRSIDGEAKRITAIILPIEEHLKGIEDARKAEIAAAKEAKAEAQRAKTQARIDALLSVGVTPDARVSDWTDKEYTRRLAEATKAHEEKLEREEAERAAEKAKAKAEAAERAREKAALEEERANIARERAELEDIRREQEARETVHRRKAEEAERERLAREKEVEVAAEAEVAEAAEAAQVEELHESAAEAHPPEDEEIDWGEPWSHDGTWAYDRHGAVIELGEGFDPALAQEIVRRFNAGAEGERV